MSGARALWRNVQRLDTFANKSQRLATTCRRTSRGHAVRRYVPVKPLPRDGRVRCYGPLCVQGNRECHSPQSEAEPCRPRPALAGTRQCRYPVENARGPFCLCLRIRTIFIGGILICGTGFVTLWSRPSARPYVTRPQPASARPSTRAACPAVKPSASLRLASHPTEAGDGNGRQKNPFRSSRKVLSALDPDV